MNTRDVPECTSRLVSEYTCGEGSDLATIWIGKAVWLTMSRVMLCENRCKPGAKPGVRPVSDSAAAHKTRVYGSCANAR